MHNLFAHVPVLDTGARGSTTTFAQRGIGDVLLAWENEAYLALKELGDDQFDIVQPSISILAEPTVTLVDGNITSDEQREAAEAYLELPLQPRGPGDRAPQLLPRLGRQRRRTRRRRPLRRSSTSSPIADFGGWAKVQPEHFGDGGIFDQIYTPQ